MRARIEAWDHPVIAERDEAAGEVGLMLQAVVRDLLPEAIPPYSSLDGVKELRATTDGEHRLHVLGAFYLLAGNDDSMLPVEAELDLAPQATSSIRLGGASSVFAMPTSERRFVRSMEGIEWAHRANFEL